MANRSVAVNSDANLQQIVLDLRATCHSPIAKVASRVARLGSQRADTLRETPSDTRRNRDQSSLSVRIRHDEGDDRLGERRVSENKSGAEWR